MVGFMKSAMNLFGIKKTSEGSGASAVGLDEFLTGLPAQLGYKIEFKRTEKSEAGLQFEIEGEEVDSFVANSSEILDALSHLAMRVQRKNEGLSNEPVSEESKESFRITFDAGGFREKKAQELREMAAEKRQRVMESGGKPAYIPALSPSDRKIIHTHLVDLGDVVSESIGKGNFKRIRVRMKDDTRRAPEARANGGERSHASGGNGGGNGNGNGGGGNRGGRGRGGRGRGPRPDRGFGNDNRGMEVDGNRAVPDRVDEIIEDDNIGNRLRPGETPLYGTSNNPGQNSE